MEEESKNEDKSSEIEIESLYNVPVEVSVILGETKVLLSNLLKFGKGAIIELDKNVGEPVDVKVNGKLVAKGEIVVVEDKVGVTLTEIIKNQK